MIARSIRGRVARVMWAYYTAATVEGYAVTQDARGWTVVATIVPGTADAFKLAQRPLRFVAPFKGGAWVWPIETWTPLDGGGRFMARLGALEGTTAHGIPARPTA